jgi:hypothetical protein
VGAKGGQVWRDQDWIQAPGVALVKENLVCVVRGVWVWGGGGVQARVVRRMVSSREGW